MKQKQLQRYIITVSRDCGCSGQSIVRQLVDELNNVSPPGKGDWRYVSKEILDESARRLKLKPGKVTRLLNAQDKNLFEEMLLGLSSENYPSDIKIKKTIKSVIEAVANEGNVVILGRGGVAVLGDHKDSLHIKLTAPRAWRIEQMMIDNDISEEKARKAVEESDKDRQSLKSFYAGRDIQLTDYDMVLNVSTLTQDQVVEAIKSAVRVKVKS